MGCWHHVSLGGWVSVLISGVTGSILSLIKCHVSTALLSGTAARGRDGLER